MAITQLWDFGSCTLSGTAAAMGTIDVKPYKTMTFVITISTETIGVSFSSDGTNFGAAVRPIDCATGALAASSALAAGTYKLDVAGMGMVKFTKSAAVQTGTIRIGFSNL